MENPEQNTGPTELDLLKSRARMMGIEFSNNIGLETLKAKIAEKLGNTNEDQDEEVEEIEEVEEPEVVVTQPAPQPNPLVQETGPNPATYAAPDPVEVAAVSPSRKVRKATLHKRIRDEQMKLVRVRITCLDPKKKDLPGEIITIANEYLGTVKKFVPYGEFTDDGFHIPYCIYNFLNKRKFLNIRTTKDRRTGTPKVESGYVKEFAIEILPPLTPAELQQLATAQIAAGSVE